MSSFEIPASAVADLCKRFGYRKKKVRIMPRTTMSLINTNWDSGSRNIYTAVALDGDMITRTLVIAAAPWDNYAEGKTFEIPLNAVVVQTGTFMGKEATMYIYVRPENLKPVLERLESVHQLAK